MAAVKKAGHRTWGKPGAKCPGTHVGDFMSVEVRSALMARIKSKETVPEKVFESELRKLQIRGYERHAVDLPGRADFVFRKKRIVVFVDGDFWHGYRFPLWEHKLSPKWREKISATRARDDRNFQTLRRRGWKVVRLWEHQIERDAAGCANKVRNLLIRK